MKDSENNAAAPPDRDFKGIWIPAELWLRQDLNALEKCLLAEIDSLDKGKGCFAGNEYLASMFGVSANRVAHIVTKLRKLRLVSTLHFDGRTRFLRVYYSRHSSAVFSRAETSLVKNNKAPLLKTTRPYSNIVSKTHCPKPARSARGRLGRSILGDEVVDPFIARCTKQLEEFVRRSRKISPIFKRPKWHNEFRLLLEALQGDKSRLKRVLVFYTTADHDQWTPQVFSAESFRKEFLRVESWVDRTSYTRPPEEEDDIPNGGVTILRRHVVD